MTSFQNAPLTHCWRLPRIVSPVFRGIYHVHFAAAHMLRWIYRTFYAAPLFLSRCKTAGRQFQTMEIPDITGHTCIEIGNHVTFHGHVGIGSGRVFDDPTLVIGDGVELGHDVVLVANREVKINRGVRIGAGCRLMDTDGHPRDAALRAANVPPPPEEIKPVYVGPDAAIGRGSFVLKGVTVGEGATVGVNSVIIADIPPYTVAAGNPARVIAKHARRSPQANSE